MIVNKLLLITLLFSEIPYDKEKKTKENKQSLQYPKDFVDLLLSSINGFLKRAP